MSSASSPARNLLLFSSLLFSSLLFSSLIRDASAGVDIDLSTTIFGTAQNGPEAECSIDSDPTNPNRIAVACVDGSAVFFRTFNVFFSHDGGSALSWDVRRLGASLDSLNVNDQRADPSLSFSENGYLYVGYQVGHETTANPYALVCARSTDGGLNYTRTSIENNPRGSLWLDKPYIATGPKKFGSGHNVFIAYRSVNGLLVRTSTDSGQTFSDPPTVLVEGNVLGQGAATFPEPAVGPDGALYVVWTVQQGGSSVSDIYVARSENEGIDFEALTPRVIASCNIGYKEPIPPQHIRGIFPVPNIEVDRSGGPRNGWVYVSFVARPTPNFGDGNTDVVLISSPDRGVT